MTPEYRRFLRARESADEVIVLLKLTHPEWTRAERLAAWGEPVTFGGEVYDPFPFSIGFPDVVEDDNPGVAFSAPNINRRMASKVLVRSGVISAEMVLLLSSDLTTPQLPVVNLSIINIQITREEISGTITFDDILDRPTTAMTFSSVYFPGLQ